jgi:hypothetical protein
MGLVGEAHDPFAGLVPDYVKFVESLEPTQAAFLHVQLQGVTKQSIEPLREALLNRVLDAPPMAGGVKRAMISDFYTRPHKIKPRRRVNGQKNTTPR